MLLGVREDEIAMRRVDTWHFISAANSYHPVFE